jgi:hypothetical protein
MRAPLLAIATLLSVFTLPADTIVKVTTTADNGAGSLRDAIERANSNACAAPCRIEFAIPAPVPQIGWFTIKPASPLPLIQTNRATIAGDTQTTFTGDTNPFGPEIEIDGSNAGLAPGLKFFRASSSRVFGLAIDNFGGNGIAIDGGAGVLVSNNYLGVDPTGRFARPNGFNGLAIINHSVAEVYFNVIGGNGGNGIFAKGCLGCRLQGNSIGFGRAEAFPIPNGANGIDLHGVGSRIEVNRIAFNKQHGVVISPTSRDITVSRNEISRNGFLSIDLNGDGWTPPAALDIDIRVTSATLESREDFGYGPARIRVRGTIQSSPNLTFRVEAFASPSRSWMGFAEARRWVAEGSAQTDAKGHADFEFTTISADEPRDPLVPGGFVAVTAKFAGTSTTELSDATPITVSFPHFEVTNTNDAGAGSLRAAIDAVNASPCTTKEPCMISFHIPIDDLNDGVARFEPGSPLPAIAARNLIFDGNSESWWVGDQNPEAPEIELRGTRAGASDGLRFGTEAVPIDEMLARGVSVNGFKGNGIVVQVSAADVRNGTTRLWELAVGPNDGNGIVLRGGGLMDAAFSGRTFVARSVISGNHGDGIVIDGGGVSVSENSIGPNDGRGIFVTANGKLATVIDNVIAKNGSAGIATDSNAQGVYIRSHIFDSVGKAIDRANGVVPKKPELFAATYDATKNITIVRGHIEPKPSTAFPEPRQGSGYFAYLNFYSSAKPDQAEAYAAGNYNSPGDFEVALPGDLRGRFLTATNNTFWCYYEFGCFGKDTSELSNSIPVP